MRLQEGPIRVTVVPSQTTDQIDGVIFFTALC